MTLKGFGKWIGRQADGFVRGVMTLFTTSPKEWLPPGIWSTILWVRDSILWSIGSSTPIRQITSAFALAVFFWLLSAVTLGLFIPIAIFLSLMIVVGFARLIPAVDQAFVNVRQTVIP